MRIRTQINGGDSYTSIKLEHNFDFLEVLSLKLSQREVYQNFSANYGAIVGRVVANGGFGVPNARVSVFIPLNENETRSDVIGRYPYLTIQDRNIDGVRYNLLPDTQQDKCHRAVGTFPSKRKALDNDIWLEIYDTYYKYTTTTNDAGDYMILGVPIGNQNLHMDVDVSDIGFASMKPYDLIDVGYNENLFDSNTTFKVGSDLDSLVQIQSADYSVNVLPFWGNDNSEVGVNRVDFNLNLDINANAHFVGSIFTDSPKSKMSKKCSPSRGQGNNCDLSTGVGQIEMIRRISNDSNIVEYISTNSKQIDENGNWAITVPLNLNRVVTDEEGNLVPSEDPRIGIATSAKVRFRVALSEYRFGLRKRTAHHLIPNLYNHFQFGDDTPDEDFYEFRWKKVYTVANYIARYQRDGVNKDESRRFIGIKKIGECENTSPVPYNRIDTNFNPLYNILCIIITALGVIFEIINTIITAIIFGVVLKFICFVKHPFSGERRSACRCQSCYNLATGFSGNDTPPSDWIGDDSDLNGVDDRLECSACYDGGDSGQTYRLDTSVDGLLPSITTNVTNGTIGTYIDVELVSSGSGDGALATVELNAANNISSITVTSAGNGFVVGEVLTISAGDLGATSTQVDITLVADDVVTTIVVDGQVIDCDNFDYEKCKGKCQDCDVSVIPLNCNGIEYSSGIEWSECVRENLAEALNVITYEFYNDWLVGSLYSFMFSYRVKFKKKGKNLERFCDFECREPSDPKDPDDEHRRNVCRDSYIVDRREFNNSDWKISDIGSNGLGVIVEYENFLYYASRHDVGVDDANAPDLTVNEKGKLLFATTIVPLGSSVSCDLDGEPYLIDNLDSTTFQFDDGTNTLFNVNNCFAGVSNINNEGISLISQVGIDVLLSEAERVSNSPVIIQSSDEEIYTVEGSESGIADSDGNVGIIVFDRDGGISIRQYLCESFDFFGTNGIYSSANSPSSVTLSGTFTSDGVNINGVGTLFLSEFSLGDYIMSNDGQVRQIVSITSNILMEIDTQFTPEVSSSVLKPINYIINADGEVVVWQTDTCIGFDTQSHVADRMVPYYFYFGIKQGNSALDKLKRNYFDNCIE